MSNSRGKLIIIEGGDGSGKKTQSDKLYERMLSCNYNIKKVEYPNYKSPSSSLVKMYLNGEFGHKPEDVDAYVASTFYGADRFASYKKEWEKFYLEQGIIIADRYTTSNMVHQASKIHDIKEKEKFLDWLWEFEFGIYKLPVPDLVIFLDMPPEYSLELMKERQNKFTGEKEKDIHESDTEYLINSYKNSLYLCEKYKWQRINCVENNKIKTVEQIHQEIFLKVEEILRNNN